MAVIKKRKRKPMTEEQRKAAGERLAAARAARLAANPPEYKNVHPDVLALDDEDALSMKNVKEWIKSNKDLLAVERKQAKQGQKGAEARAQNIASYIRIMETYLQSATWLGLFWGERQENPMSQACLAMAYDKDGYPKRNVGTWYADIATVWTQEMDIEDRAQRKA
jgi:glycerol-3-phosphate cytidylyltransferase-like family protein